MPPRMRRRITTAKREEIEAEQKAIENAIVRPFETLEGLPISYNEPPNGNYESILKTPLTIKDSAVLYNSLIRSRGTYVYHAPMFKLHWVKQTAYAKKLAEMDKEKQNEILKDRGNKRKFTKATTSSLEARTRIPVLSPEVNARDVMSKLCESSITLGPHTMEIRIFIAKDSRSEKSRAISELTKLGDGKPAISDTGLQDSNSMKDSPLDINEVSTTTSSASKLHVPQSILKEDRDRESSNQPANTHTSDMIDGQRTISKSPVETPEPLSKDSSQARDESLIKGITIEAHSYKPMTSPELKDSATSVNGCVHEVPQNDNASPKDTPSAADLSKNDSNVDTNHVSGIQKPSTMKEKDNIDRSPVISSLPPGLKSHQSSNRPKIIPNKTLSTQTRVSIADSVPANTQLAPESTISTSSNARMPPSSEANPNRLSSTNLQSIDNTIMISNLNAIAKIDLSLNDLMKEVALGKASEAQINRFKKYIERAKQMGPQPHHADLYFSRGLPLPPDFPRPYLTRPLVEKRTVPKPKIVNPMKLTAFQERYLHNATLVFEFLENPNVRYVIPQDSICEVMKSVLPPPANVEMGTEYNDVLFSHLWIHNVEDLERYEEEYRNFEAEVRKQREEETKRTEGSGDADQEDLKSANETAGEKPLAKNGSKSQRTKRKGSQQRKQALSAPEFPHIRYTAFSFTVHNIPSRFIPIFVNSMKPLKDVQQRMEQIILTGSRMASFYLWYQVDARLDEEFAENLRTSAVAEERKMSGSLSTAEPKKRKPRDPKTLKKKPHKDKSLEAEITQEHGILGGASPAQLPAITDVIPKEDPYMHAVCKGTKDVSGSTEKANSPILVERSGTS